MGARNSRDVDLTVSGVWQSHESSGPLPQPSRCEGAWHQSQKALNRSRVGSWESSNKITVNIANIWECFIKHLKKKILPINPNPVLQALRTLSCPTFWLWTPKFRKIHLITELLKGRTGIGTQHSVAFCCLFGILLPGCGLLPHLFWLQKGEGAGTLLPGMW